MENIPEKVLFRIVRGDDKGRPFGTPRNPRVPTIEEFNPRIFVVAAGRLGSLIVARRHGLFPEQEAIIAEMSNDVLLEYCIDDPISTTQLNNGLSLTGGHHRISEIIKRVESTQLDADMEVRILVHD